MCVSRVTCSESLVRFKEKVFKKNYLGGLSATFLYKASLVWCLKPYYVAVPIKKVRKRLLLWAKKRCSEAKCLWQKKTLHRWRSIIVMQLESKLLIYQQKIIWSSEYLLKSGKTVVKKRTPAFPPKKKVSSCWGTRFFEHSPRNQSVSRSKRSLYLPQPSCPWCTRDIQRIRKLKLFFANSCIYLVGLCQIINQNNSKLTWMYRKTFFLYNHPAFGYDMTKSQYSRLGIDDSTSGFRCE